jgi:hypothetical protein
MMTRLLVPTLLALAAQGAWAQAPASGDALLRELEQAKQMIRELQQRVEQLESKVEASQTVQAPAPPPVAPTPPKPAAPVTVPVAQPKGLLGRMAVSGYQPPVTMRGDDVAEQRGEGIPVDADLKGFFRLPGTQTLMRFGGYVKLDAIYDFKPIGSYDSFITSEIPLGPPESNYGRHANLHAKQSRINVDFRRDTPIGTARLFAEGDFYGDQSFGFESGSYQFRLRHAFGELANFGVGYTYSTFMDADALTDTLDFEGPGSAPFLFTPQLRYTYPVSENFKLSAAIEGSKSDITTPTGIATERAPDVALRARYEGEKGHIQLSGILRRVSYTDGSGAGGNANGGGVQLAGIWKTFGDDYLAASGIYGKGIARYISDISGLGLDAIVDPSGGLTALTAKGGYAGYTHYWTPKLRTTAVAGVLNMDNKDFQPGDAFRQSQYYSANMIWVPYGSLALGVEYMFGKLKSFDGTEANANRLQMSVQYDFVR